MATTTTTTSSSAMPSLSTSGAPAAKRQLPEVQSLPNTASIDEVVSAIKIAGGCVIKNAVSTDVLDKIEYVTRPSVVWRQAS